jgi:hypothetical protein
MNRQGEAIQRYENNSRQTKISSFTVFEEHVTTRSLNPAVRRFLKNSEHSFVTHHGCGEGVR